MIPEIDDFIPPAELLHDTINQLSSIISIAQYCLIGREVSSEVQNDLNRIVEMTKDAAANLKRLAEILEEEEEG